MNTILTDRQAQAFEKEVTLSFEREKMPFSTNEVWTCFGCEAEWVGFQDDYGTFVPVDWC